MARIANDELERLKQQVSVERLVVARGVRLKRHGKDLIGRARCTTTRARAWW
jgi:hypothetical protein